MFVSSEESQQESRLLAEHFRDQEDHDRPHEAAAGEQVNERVSSSTNENGCKHQGFHGLTPI